MALAASTISKVGAFSEKGARSPGSPPALSSSLSQVGSSSYSWSLFSLGSISSFSLSYLFSLCRQALIPLVRNPYEEGEEGSLFPKASGDHNKERCDFRSEQRRTKRPPRDVSEQQPVACVCVCVCESDDRGSSLSFSRY